MSIRKILKGVIVTRREVAQENGTAELRLVAVRRFLGNTPRYYITITTKGKTFVYAQNEILDNLYEDFRKLHRTFSEGEKPKGIR